MRLPSDSHPLVGVDVLGRGHGGRRVSTRSFRTCTSATGRGCSQRVDDEFRKRLRDRAQKSLLFKDLRELAAVRRPAGPRMQPSLRQRFEAMVEQSGLDLTPSRLLAIIVAQRSDPGCLWQGLSAATMLVAMVGAVIGAVVPLCVCQNDAEQAPEKLLSQLPDAFDLMSRVIRRGRPCRRPCRRSPTSSRRRSPASSPICYRAAEPRPSARDGHA